jgi:ferric-dicitrate binding protein FerR (iron transport regulator)
MSEELFERYLRNELDDAGARELSAILDTDEGARAFSEFVQEWTLLGEAALQRVAEADRQGSRKHRRRAPKIPTGRSWIGWAVGMAAALLFLLTLLSPGRPPRRDEKPVAHVVPAIPPPIESPAPAPPAPPPPPVPATPSGPLLAPAPPLPSPPPAPAPVPPKVEPSREPLPEVRPVEPSKVVRAAVAVLARVQGDVQRTSPAGRRKVVAGDDLTLEEGIESAHGSHALLEYPDGTKMEIGPDSSVERLTERQGRKVLALTRGTVLATVTKQTAGRSVAVATPHAEVLVLGTQFSVVAGPDSSRVEVREGRVRVTRPDGASLELSAGHFAVAAKGLKLESKPIVFTRDFQEGAAYTGMRDTEISGADPNRAFGSDEVLEVDGDEVEGKKLYALVRWDLSDLPPGAVVRSAVITLYIVNESQGTGYSFYELKRPWNEAEATWKLAAAQQPWRVAGARSTADRDSVVLGTVAPRAKGEMKILMLPAGEDRIQSWIRTPASNHGMILANDANADGFKFSSREAPIHERRPKLTLTYTLAGK